MSKMKKEDSNIELNEVRAKLRKVITDKYGGVTKFLSSNEGKKFGGVKVRPYLYDSAAVNFKVLKSLCSYFGVGELSRDFVITRVVTYKLSKCATSK